MPARGGERAREGANDGQDGKRQTPKRERGKDDDGDDDGGDDGYVDDGGDADDGDDDSDDCDDDDGDMIMMMSDDANEPCTPFELSAIWSHFGLTCDRR